MDLQQAINEAKECVAGLDDCPPLAAGEVDVVVGQLIAAIDTLVVERDSALRLSAQAADTVVEMSRALTAANQRAEKVEKDLEITESEVTSLKGRCRDVSIWLEMIAERLEHKLGDEAMKMLRVVQSWPPVVRLDEKILRKHMQAAVDRADNAERAIAAAKEIAESWVAGRLASEGAFCTLERIAGALGVVFDAGLGCSSENNSTPSEDGT